MLLSGIRTVLFPAHSLFGDFKMNSLSIQGWLTGKHTVAHVLLQCNLWPTFPALCFCDFFRLQPGLNRSTPSPVKIAIGSAGDFVLSTWVFVWSLFCLGISGNGECPCTKDKRTILLEFFDYSMRLWKLYFGEGSWEMPAKYQLFLSLLRWQCTQIVLYSTVAGTHLA